LNYIHSVDVYTKFHANPFIVTGGVSRGANISSDLASSRQLENKALKGIRITDLGIALSCVSVCLYQTPDNLGLPHVFVISAEQHDDLCASSCRGDECLYP